MIEKVQAHQRLANAGRAHDQSGGARPVPRAPEQVIERRDTAFAAFGAQLVASLVLQIGEARENGESAIGDAIKVLPRLKAAASQLHDLEDTHLSFRDLFDVQGDDRVGDGKFGFVNRVRARIRRVPYRGCGCGGQLAGQAVEKAAEVARVRSHRVERAKAVDDDERRLDLLEVAVDRADDVIEPLLQDLAHVLVHDAALADRLSVEELERFRVSDDLVERL